MNKLISNYMFTVVYQVLLMLTPFITIPYVSRVLGVEGVGADAYVTSVVQLFLVFSVLSIPLYGSRQIATKTEEDANSKEFWSIFAFQFFASIINLIVFLSYILLISNHKWLFLINIFMILSASLDISWYFIGKEKIKKTTIRNAVVKVVGVLLIFIFINDTDDLALYVLINSSTMFIGQLIMWIPLFKEVKYTKLTLEDLKVHFRPILMLFIPQAMIQVYVLVNRVILGNISGEIEVGYYSQANKIIRLVLGIITSVSTVMLPRMALEFSRGNSENIRKYIDYSLQFILLLTIPMALGLMAIAPEFVIWFFGPSFSFVTTLLIVMSPVVIFVGLANVFGVQVLISTNQQKKYSIAITSGALLSLVTNLVLVQSLGSLATTISLLVAEATGAIISMIYARSYFDFNNFLKMFMKYTSISLVFFLFVRLIEEFSGFSAVLNTLIALSIGIVIYVTGLLLTKDTMVLMGLSKSKGILLKRYRHQQSSK